MSETVKKFIPMVITSLSAIIVTVAFFFKLPYVNDLSDYLTNLAALIALMSMALGAITLNIHQFRIIRKRGKYWYFEAYTFILIYVMLIVSFLPNNVVFDLIYNYIYKQGLSVMKYPVEALFATYAAYRALRVRDLNSTLLMIFGVVVMLSMAPVGEVIWGQFPVIGEWLLEVPTEAALRGIVIAVAVGVITMAYRTITGAQQERLG